MAHKVAALVVSDGVDRALEEYHRIKRMEEDMYYFMDFEFMRISKALSWSGHHEDAVRILTCAAAKFIITIESD